MPLSVEVSNNTPGNHGRRDPLGCAWLIETRTSMLSGSAMATERLIGKVNIIKYYLILNIY